jgi:glycerol-3-phosphate acyltransferase PlsY
MTALLLIAAYLIGSLPFAIITSKLFGLADPRHYGSGNPGATNVLRSGHKGAAALTLLGDCAKGWVVVFIAQQLGFSLLVSACAGVVAFLGHVFSIFLRGKGGKGVATALGVLLGIHPGLALIVLLTWLGVAFVSRYSSLAALSAATMAPIAGGLLLGDMRLVLVLLIMTVILFWRHADNIRRLINGSESKIGSKKKSS